MNIYLWCMTTIKMQSLFDTCKTEASTIVATFQSNWNMLKKKHFKLQDKEGSNTIKNSLSRNTYIPNLFHQKNTESMKKREQCKLSRITSSVVYAQQTQIFLSNYGINSYHRVKNTSSCSVMPITTQPNQQMKYYMENAISTLIHRHQLVAKKLTWPSTNLHIMGTKKSWWICTHDQQKIKINVIACISWTRNIKSAKVVHFFQTPAPSLKFSHGTIIK